jgi:hypothetical protein
MMASMHLVLRQQDGGEKDAGEYRHVTNTSFEKFVERYHTFLIMFPHLPSSVHYKSLYTHTLILFERIPENIAYLLMTIWRIAYYYCILVKLFVKELFSFLKDRDITEDLLKFFNENIFRFKH